MKPIRLSLAKRDDGGQAFGVEQDKLLQEQGIKNKTVDKRRVLIFTYRRVNQNILSSLIMICGFTTLDGPKTAQGAASGCKEKR
jgi:hypothetical protein